MKKILASLLVLAMCAPAMAATISVVDNTDGTATVTVAVEGEEPNIVGLALDVDAGGSATVTDVVIETGNFNIYPDAAYTEELGDGYDYGEGGPVAAKATRGEISLPQSSFALSFGNLNGATTAGADGAASVEITITLSEPNSLTVCENSTRGGIVAVNGDALDADCDSADITGGGGCATCIGDVTGDGVIDLFNDLLTIGIALQNNNYNDLSLAANPDLVCADTDDNGVIDLFNDLLTIGIQLQNNNYNDINCPE
jgi:hypothetical protein